MIHNISMARDLDYTSNITMHCIDKCMHGDIRLREKAMGNTAAGTGGLEVCVSGSWTTVCHTGWWHSNPPNDIQSNNRRVACRQLGYREEGTNHH